jgi:hypothetical protein
MNWPLYKTLTWRNRAFVGTVNRRDAVSIASLDSTANATRNDLPIPCHSHNDYRRTVPLFDALSAGCTSVEADIWLTGNDTELYVGHNRRSLSEKRTLRSLYLDPLIEILSGTYVQSCLQWMGSLTIRCVFSGHQVTSDATHRRKAFSKRIESKPWSYSSISRQTANAYSLTYNNTSGLCAKPIYSASTTAHTLTPER